MPRIHGASNRDPASGLIDSLTDEAGQSTRLQRDARGNPIAVTAPDGSTTRSRYTDPRFSDRPGEIIDARGGRKTLAWTALGQIESHTD